MKMLKMKWVAAGLLAATMGSAQATPLASQFFEGFQQLSDNSAEKLVDMGGSAAGKLDLGDRLTGIFTIETIEKSPFPTRFTSPTGRELTGIFDITVVGKAGGPGAFSFAFAPTAGFDIDPTVVIRLYDASNFGGDVSLGAFTRVTVGAVDTVAEMMANASDGLPFAKLGFGATSFWFANAVTDDIATIGSFPPPGNGGGFNLGLDFKANTSGVAFRTVPCFNPVTFTVVAVGTCGSGSLLAKGDIPTPFDSFDDINFVVSVSEPSSIALVGLALVGLSGFARRRKS